VFWLTQESIKTDDYLWKAGKIPGVNCMYEHRKQPLAKRNIYYRRIFMNILFAFIIIIVFLLIGTAGYRYFEKQNWLDCFHQASMILSGMGPVIEIHTDGGKWFSSIYAVFSGVVFISNIGLILAPALHRLFHKLHLEEK
jgi:putative effector of murein hydrolase